MKGLAGILLAAGSAAAFVGMANAQPSETGPRAVLFDQPNFQGQSITIVEGAPDLGRWGFAGARALSARFEGDWTVCDAADLDGQCTTVKGEVADLSKIGLRRIVSLGEAAQDSGSDSHGEAAGLARTDESARAGQQVAAAADDVRVPGARIGGASAAFDSPAPPAPPAAVAPPAKPAPSVATQVAAAPPPPAAPAVPPAPSAPTGPGAPQQLAFAGPPAAEAPASGAAQAGQGDAGRSAVFFAKPTRGGAEVAVDVRGPADQFCREQGLGPAVYFDTDGKVLRDVLCRRS